ncbi:hypothetical protein B0H11DRAFT_2262223 [Mycena galericulata]|nr:hypothetical protein B0H11DRAFT_2262223 [Mycena galericulata]
MNLVSTPSLPASDSESELAEILAVFDHLTLNDRNVAAQSKQQPRGSPVDTAQHTAHHRNPAPRVTPSSPPPSTPERPRLYRYESPSKSGYTPHWDVAAEVVHDIPGATARRLNKKKKGGGKKGGYAVFVGTQIGTFARWEDARRFVDGVPGNIHQGYSSLERAQAAFEYARQRSWTRVVPAAGRPMLPPPAAIPKLPTPIDFVEAPNALHDGDSLRDGLWYVVYSGINPGVYQSSLECMLNTVGLPDAVHDSWRSQEAAVNSFQQALTGGRVHTITPPYYS